MSALNSTETNVLSEAEKVLNTAARMADAVALMLNGDEDVEMEAGAYEWLAKECRKTQKSVNTVKQMKGHYPK